jgi:hypothetical protein
VKSTAPTVGTGPVQDPAGLDQLLLAAAKGLTRFAERVAGDKLGRPVTIWDGKDGLGAVLDEHLRAAGVPNKRLPELLTPRLVISQITPRRPRRRVR